MTSFASIDPAFGSLVMGRRRTACRAPDGHLMGKIPVPEVVSDICFGGRAKHQLFITATTSLYAISLNRNGAQTP